MLLKIISGKFLSRLEKKKNIFLLFYVLLLVILLLSYKYYTHNQYRELLQKQNEYIRLREINVELLIKKNNLLRYNSIKEKAEKQGLYETKEIYNLIPLKENNGE